MTDYFRDAGRALLANGYLIVPIIPGAKRPALSGWQSARITASDLGQWPGHGVGVLCGQGATPVVGIDIDISHPVIGPHLIAWCQENLGLAAERVGNAPRVLLAYRADSSAWTKGTSTSFIDPLDPIKPDGKANLQRVEVLCAGQQFVAYHIHPDTGRPYEWTDVFGGLEHMRADDLSEITERQVSALLAEVDRVVRSTPGIEVQAAGADLGSRGQSGTLAGLSPGLGLTIEQAREHIFAHDNTGEGVDYDHWVRVGMALHHEFEGSEPAYALWREWGALSTKKRTLSEKDERYKWETFGRCSDSPTTMKWVIKVANQAREDAALDGQRETLAEVRKLLGQAQDTVDLTVGIAKRLKSLMPDDGPGRAEVLGLFQAKFRELSGGTRLPAAELRTLLTPVTKAAQQAVAPGVRQLTEFGNAERMLDKFGVGLMFVPELGKWYSWTTIHWAECVPQAVEHLAKETIRALPREAEMHSNDASEFFRFCAISQHASMVANMVKLASSDPRVMVPARALDSDLDLVGVRNGVLRLSTGELLPPDPNLRVTMLAGCEYHPEAQCPTFDRTLLQIFSGDAEMAEYFMLILGYALSGRPVLSLMVILHGLGANGKSTLMTIMRKVFGQYAKTADASTFITEPGKGGGNAGGPREDLLRLRGARLVIVNEPDEGGELREGAIKAMTGGDTITARGINAKNSVEIEPTWTIVMPTNHKPLVRGTDHGIWRRIVLVPFERNFETDKTVQIDRNLGDKLDKELPGVLARVVRAYLSYKTGGIVHPERVRLAKEQYRNQMDLLAEWIAECCEVGESYEQQSSDLWESWQIFASKNGVLNYVKSNIALARRLDAKFPGVRQSHGLRYRCGIRLKQQVPF